MSNRYLFKKKKIEIDYLSAIKSCDENVLWLVFYKAVKHVKFKKKVKFYKLGYSYDFSTQR